MHLGWLPVKQGIFHISLFPLIPSFPKIMIALPSHFHCGNLLLRQYDEEE